MVVRLRFREQTIFSYQWRTAFNSEDPRHVTGKFLGRTSLSGQISEGNCSLRLDPVHLEDSQRFEMVLKAPEDRRWGTPRFFTLEVSERPEYPVISGPGSVTEGQLVSLNCTVNFSCPSRPPVLHWHWERGARPKGSGGGVHQLVHPLTNSPLLLSSLSFNASHSVKPRLRCAATYPGGAIVGALREVHITCTPLLLLLLFCCFLVQLLFFSAPLQFS